jgi:hypothetical protein
MNDFYKEKGFILHHGSGVWEVQDHGTSICSGSGSTHGRKQKGKQAQVGETKEGQLCFIITCSY